MLTQAHFILQNIYTPEKYFYFLIWFDFVFLHLFVQQQPPKDKLKKYRF